MSLDEHVIKATLGALVHDIGKVGVQATGRDASFTRFDCETPAKHISFAQCTSCRSRFRYAHAPLGAHVLREVGAPDWMQQVALDHHGSAATAGAILRAVRLGDQLAAGERDDLPINGASRAPHLRNVFATSDAAIAPEPLQIDVMLGAPPSTVVGDDYARTEDALEKALKTALEYAGGDITAMVDHLLGAVQRGATFVPSAFSRTIADISLASHLQLAAAFAGAVALRADGAPPGVDETVASLIVGDLSGIQPFVHRVASRRAARALRARSFYIQLVAEVVARYVAEGTGVTAANVISAAGGGFLVIAPHDAQSKLGAIRARVEERLFIEHGPALSVAFACVPLSARDTEGFAVRMSEGLRLLREQKWRRFEAFAESVRLFAPRGAGGPSRACRSCGGDAPQGVEDSDGRLCTFCHSLESMGRELTQNRFLLIRPRRSGDGGLGEAWKRLPASLGYDVELANPPPTPPVAGAILALDGEALECVPCARLFPVGRHVPTGPDGAIDFERIASQFASGRALLAVIKADVDDLGVLLQTHFTRDGDRVDSPSRLATFSRMLSLFFEGHINEMAQKFPGMYVVFAGGDDLLAVGPWNQALAFLSKVRADFARWTAHNPAFHLSAGIAFGQPSRPVMHGLEEAEQNLRRAKSLPGKAAVSLLGHDLKWTEFDQVLEWRDVLVGVVSGSGQLLARGARALLQRLEQLEHRTTSGARELYGPHVWRMHYYLRRFAERHRVGTSDLNRIEQEVLTKGGTNRLAIAARLAEFETSTRGED